MRFLELSCGHHGTAQAASTASHMATAAQAVNFFVQKNLVFRSNAQFRQALPKYICWQLCWF